MGLIGNILQPLYVGFPSVLFPPAVFIQNPLIWLQLISKHQATTSGGPNFAYEHCINRITDQQKTDLDLSCWEIAFNGAEPIRAETLDRFAAAFSSCGFRKEAFYPCYGMAEATLMISGSQPLTLPKTVFLNIGNDADGKTTASLEKVSCGSPQLDQKILIVDPQSLTVCPDKNVGEIWTSGPSVAQGYWHRPEETKYCFQAYLADGKTGPFLRTGDLGFISVGELFVTGRLKDLIIIRGHNHYPQDIEQTVEKSHPSLNPGAAAAFSIEERGEERLVIIHEVKRSTLRTLNAKEVFACMRKAVLQQHELDVYAIILVKTYSIPRTSSGKIQRPLCKAGFLSSKLKTIDQWRSEVKPRSAASNTPPLHSLANRQSIEKWLTTNIAKKTNVAPAQINLHEPLASYGLDSMAVVSLSGELETWLGRKLSPTLVYDYPTVESLAVYLAGEGEPANYPAPTISTSYPEQLNDPIAIIGMGCRFPGSSSPEDFWRILQNGNDAITAVPSGRWDSSQYPSATRHGGFLDTIDLFDPLFFGISPREAECMDPQQRLLLEVTREALESAFLPPDTLAGTKTGVFVGISSHDYADRQRGELAFYLGTGNAQSIAANRISYTFDLRGPSLSVDTACSSSLVAVHQACQSLRHGESDTAIVGGVNIILSPDLSCIFSQAGMLAENGRCKTFDASADGYVRGEGCGVVILKRLSDALADGNPILASIRGSAVNQDGRSNGLTAPNGISQQAVIRAALTNGKIHPDQVGYVEAHGTGTFLGDPIEYNSLVNVFSPRSSNSSPCYVGSVKTNIGHLEAAAGIAGLIKAVLMLKYAQIPPNLHLKELNPHLPANSFPMTVPRHLEPWEEHEHPRIAGVSSFGFGGTNAHVVVQEAPSATGAKKTDSATTTHLLVLSAKDELSLTTLAQRYDFFIKQHQNALPEICARAATGREHFEQRLAVMGKSADQLCQGITAFLNGNTKSSFVAGRAMLPPQKLVFLFSGLGRQYTQMGRTLYENEPLFRAAMDKCAQIADPLLAKPLLEILYPRIDEVAGSFKTGGNPTALFALEYSLAELWLSWGVTPDAVLGHGLGEYIAACVAGIFSLEDGLRLVSELGQARQPALQATLKRAVGRISFSTPKIQLVSSLTGIISDEVASPAYWIRQIPDSGQYYDGIIELERLGFRIFIEMGPRPLSPEPTVPSVSSKSIFLPSLQEGMQNPEQMLTTLAALYTKGVQIDWRSFHGAWAMQPCPALPCYPFRRKRYWRSERSGKSNYSTFAEERELFHPLLGRQLYSPSGIRETIFEAKFGKSLPSYLRDYRLQGRAQFPTAAFIEMLLAAAITHFKTELVQLEEVTFASPLESPCEQERIVHTIIKPENGDKTSIKIFSCNNDDKAHKPNWTLHVSATIHPHGDGENFEEISSLSDGVLVEDFYQQCHSNGLDYGELFQGLYEIRRRADCVQGSLALKDSLKAEADAYRVHPTLLDAALQVVWAILPEELGKYAWEPVALSRLCLHQAPETKAVSRVHLDPTLNFQGEMLSFDLVMEGEGGNCILKVEGFSLHKIASTPHFPALTEMLYETAWLPSPPNEIPTPINSPQRWMIFADQGGVGKRLASLLKARGDDICMVYAGNSFEKVTNGFRVNPAEPTDFITLFQQVWKKERCDGLVHLWSLDCFNDSPFADPLDEALRLGCQATLHLLQGLLKQEHSGIRLSFVTNGAMAVDEVDSVQLFQSPLWGLARTVANEHPELSCCCIDLQTTDNRAIESLFREVTSISNERQIAFRNHNRLVARLVQSSVHAPSPRVEIHGDSSYLITGGSGGIGLQIAKLLISQGAGTVILTGRTASPEMLSLDFKKSVLGRTKIVVLPADVADCEDMSLLLDNIRKTERPLKGIIHAAGVLEDCLLSQMPWKVFANVLAPKVRGAWNLHVLTYRLDLDFFVCFSSIASFLGPPTQGNYAAANTFLDALCHYRKGLRLPAVALDWGPWKDVGMISATSKSESIQKRMDEYGIAPLSPSQGIEALSLLLDSQTAQIAVMPTDWSKFFQRISADTKTYFKTLAALVNTEKNERSPSIAERAKGIAEANLYTLLFNSFRRSIAEVLDLGQEEFPSDRPLTNLGLDSLMAFELANRVQEETGLRLSPVEIMEGMTLQGLVTATHGYLRENRSTCAVGRTSQQKMEGSAIDANTLVDNSDPIAILANLNHLSDDEIEELLTTIQKEKSPKGDSLGGM